MPGTSETLVSSALLLKHVSNLTDPFYLTDTTVTQVPLGTQLELDSLLGPALAELLCIAHIMIFKTWLRSFDFLAQHACMATWHQQKTQIHQICELQNPQSLPLLLSDIFLSFLLLFFSAVTISDSSQCQSHVQCLSTLSSSSFWHNTIKTWKTREWFSYKFLETKKCKSIPTQQKDGKSMKRCRNGGEIQSNFRDGKDGSIDHSRCSASVRAGYQSS